MEDYSHGNNTNRKWRATSIKTHSFGTKLGRGGGSVTPQSGTPGKIDSYVVRARKTLPLTGGKSSPVGFRESRREITLELDLTAVTDLRG